MHQNKKDKFKRLYSLFENNNDEEEKIRLLLKEIEEEEKFVIDIYEVQVEKKPTGNPLQRTLETIAHNYNNDPEEATIKIKKRNKWVYKGQTTYAFIKNRPMWITTTKGEPLLRKTGQNNKYCDCWSKTDPKEIPDFWACDEPDPQVQNIRTSVIVPLKFSEGMISSFGFIDFETTEYVELKISLRVKFEEVAKIVASRYVQDKIDDNKQKS